MSEEIVLNLEDGFKCGALGCVIFELTRRFAYKLFKSPQHPHNWSDPPSEDEIRQYFSSELQAYEIVRLNHEQLSQHVVQFFGVVEIKRVVGKNQEDLSSQFLLGSCLKFERLGGVDVKIATVEKRFNYIQKFIQLLHSAGN